MACCDKKDIICFDLDDTIADSAPTIIQYAQKCDIEKFGGTGHLGKISNNCDYFYFARMLNWTTEQLIIFFDNYYLQYLKDIKPKPEASIVLSKFKQLGFDIHIVTSRVEKDNNIVEKITHEWFEKNEITFDKLIINQDEKGDYVKKVNAKFFVDDSLVNCLSVNNYSSNTKVYLMKTDFNCDVENDSNIDVVSNLEELYTKIEKKIKECD